MFTQSQEHSVLMNDFFFVWASMAGAGTIIVVWKSGGYFLSHILLLNYLWWFLLTSFVTILFITGFFVHIRAKENCLIQIISTLLLTPFFIVVFMLLTIFMSEMFYGGSGYHGDYLFPFLRRTT